LRAHQVYLKLKRKQGIEYTTGTNNREKRDKVTAMANRTPEQEAREKIDHMLEQAGWAVQDMEELNFRDDFPLMYL
jgi:hypothetical protein